MAIFLMQDDIKKESLESQSDKEIIEEKSQKSVDPDVSHLLEGHTSREVGF